MAFPLYFRLSNLYLSLPINVSSRTSSRLLTILSIITLIPTSINHLLTEIEEKNAIRFSRHNVSCVLLEIINYSQIIEDVRGKGLIISIELVKRWKTKESAFAEAVKICNRVWKLGLTTIVMEIHTIIIEITSPLIITKKMQKKVMIDWKML